MQNLLPDLNVLISHAFWQLIRTLALFSTAPVFSEKAAPKKVRVGLAVLIAFLLAPTLPENRVVLMSVTGLWVTIRELLIGSAIGLTVQFIFAALRFAGEVVGMQMGLSFAAFFDPSGNQSMPVLARILNVLAVLLFLAGNGHLYLIKMLADSYTLLPISGATLTRSSFYRLPEAAGLIFSSGLQIGMPVVTLLLALNLTLGLLNRLTPQLSIFVIGFPISITLGLGALLLMMYNLPTLFQEQMNEIFSAVNNILVGFR